MDWREKISPSIKSDPIDEVESYPTSPAVEALIENTWVQRDTLWTSGDDIIEIDENSLPSAISAGFYFGAKSDIRDIRTEISEYKIDGQESWDFNMSFLVKSQFEYTLNIGNERDFAVMKTKDAYENTTELSIDKTTAALFILALRCAITKDSLPNSLVAQYTSNINQQTINKVLLNALESMSDIAGIKSVITRADIPRDDDGNLINLRRVEKNSPRSNSTDIEISVTYDDLDNDQIAHQVTFYTGATMGDYAHTAGYAEYKELGVSTDDYRSAVSMSEITGSSHIPINTHERILPINEDYAGAANLCVDALRRQLKKYTPAQDLSFDAIDEEFLPWKDE